MHGGIALNREGALITLTDFVAEHGLGLTRFAYLLCGDRGLAEDLVQDTYLAIYRRFGTELTTAAPVAYARRSLVNTFVSQARRRSSGEAPLGELPETPAERASCTEEQDAMWRAIATLPERQRAVLVLRYYLDLTDREIAALLDSAEGTVRSLAVRAFAALREHPQLIGAEDSR